MAKLLMKDVKAELEQNGIGIVRKLGEYKVWPKAENCGGLGTYFTDDLHDALMTGLSMAKDAGTLVTRVDRPAHEVITDGANDKALAAIESLPSDRTVIHTLGQLNAMLKPEAQGWTVRRSPAGYYYMTHEQHAPSAGIYVYSCKGTTLGYWRKALADVIAEAI